MLATVPSATLVGLAGRVIRVEVDVAPGLPSVRRTRMIGESQRPPGRRRWSWPSELGIDRDARRPYLRIGDLAVHEDALGSEGRGVAEGHVAGPRDDNMRTHRILEPPIPHVPLKRRPHVLLERDAPALR